MSRYVLLLFLGISLYGCDKDTHFTTEEGYKSLVICHSIGNGLYEEKKIPVQDLKKHLDHGDGFSMMCHEQTQMFMGKDCKLYEVYHRQRCLN